MVMLCRAKTGTYFNYGSVFAALWTVVGIMANTGALGIYLPNTLVNVCIVAGVFVFGLVYSIFAKKERTTALTVLEMSSVVRVKAMLVANAAALVFMIPHFMVSLNLIRTRGFAYLRAVNYTGFDVTGRSTLINLILENLCFPLFVATAILGVIMILTAKKGAIPLIIAAVVNTTVYEFTVGARNGFVVLMVVAVFAAIKIGYPLVRERIKLPRSLKWILYPIGLLLVWVVIYITGERSLEQKSLFENFYYYFFAGPSYLTQLLEHMQEYRLNQDLFLGSGTFGFVYNLIATVLNRFGLGVFDSGYVLNSVLSNVYYQVSDSTRLNAMATLYFPFLMDWGYVGIVLGPAIVAAISTWIARQQRKTNAIRWYAIGIFWMYVLYRTIFKWDMLSMASFFILLFLFLFTKTEKQA